MKWYASRRFKVLLRVILHSFVCDSCLWHHLTCLEKAVESANVLVKTEVENTFICGSEAVFRAVMMEEYAQKGC